jgi:hypothetical protein
MASPLPPDRGALHGYLASATKDPRRVVDSSGWALNRRAAWLFVIVLTVYRDLGGMPKPKSG